MTEQVFPYANVVVGVLIFVIGFLLHWVGQVISVINWELAARIGIVDKNIIPEFKVYERGTAAADSVIGWIYGIAAIGLILDIQWAYKLAWFPGVIFVYHGLNFWFWVGEQNKIGHPTNSKGMRIGWSLINITVGILAILIAWVAM